MRDPFRLAVAFFASGAAALLFEVLWFRALAKAHAVKGAELLLPALRCWN